MDATRQRFTEAMDDDFNTAGALGHLFDFVRGINLARDSGVDDQGLKPAQALLLELASILGIRMVPQPAAKAGAAEPFIDLLVAVRTELRTQKLWSLSDQIRDRLLEMDVILEDSKSGTTWRWK
jgi:cysteinyl-tRNA synthetase